MSIEEIEDKVIKIIAARLRLDPANIKPEYSLVDDLSADSLDLVELVMDMEDKFRFVTAEDDAEKLKTVQDVINYVDVAVSK